MGCAASESEPLENDESKYIGKGASGCVFSGVRSCKNSMIAIGPDVISKIFWDKKAYDSECTAMEKVNKIDSENIFSVKLIYKCEISYNKLLGLGRAVERAAISCPELFYSFDDEDILFKIDYAHGGKNLTNWEFEETEFNSKNLTAQWEAAKSIFQGLVTMATEGKIHNDIKPSNVLYNQVDEKMKLIDWEAMTSNKEYPSPYGTPYFMPPETPERPKVKQEMTDHFEFLLKRVYGDEIKIEEWKVSSYNKPLSESIILKRDTYSWGVTLLEHFYHYNMHNVSEEESVPYWYKPGLELIKQMINPNPEDRFDARQAHDGYMKIKPIEYYRACRKCRRQRRRRLGLV